MLSVQYTVCSIDPDTRHPPQHFLLSAKLFTDTDKAGPLKYVKTLKALKTVKTIKTFKTLKTEQTLKYFKPYKNVKTLLTLKTLKTLKMAGVRHPNYSAFIGQLSTAVQPVFNPFSQFIPQLELYSQLQLSLGSDPIAFSVPKSTQWVLPVFRLAWSFYQLSLST